MQYTISKDKKTGKKEITTARTLLRGAKPRDVDELNICFSNHEVMRYWSTLPHESKEQTSEWVDKMIESYQNGRSDFVIVLCHPAPKQRPQAKEQMASSETVIGKIGIWQGNEIGFLLAREYWGQGLAVEVVTTVINITFDVDHSTAKYVDGFEDSKEDPMEEIIADVDPRNKASLGLLQKLGFTVYDRKEKTFQVGNVWVDSVYLKLTKDVWIKRQDENSHAVNDL